ncbi:MAG: hypothetical protein H0W84_13750, partial [Bacteroidetes bacterium]|nr:hypothetical protein [Bacteroidota bacterium]
SGGGYYLISFNTKANTPVIVSENKFSEELINKVNNYSTNIAKSVLTGKEGVFLDIKNIQAQSNGKMVIVYEIVQPVKHSEVGTLTEYEYQGKDIIVNYHKSNLDFNKSIVIEKNQIVNGIGSGSTSFALVEKNNKLCFFYNPFQSHKDNYQFTEADENGIISNKNAYLRCFNDLSTSYDDIYFKNSFFSSSDNCWFFLGDICHKSRIVRFDY